MKKIKKAPGDIIILHRCTINDNHMMYGSWDMKHDEQNFSSFWTVFCPLLPPPFPRTSQKIKILKNWKKCLEISFCTSVPKIMIICYTRDYFRNWGQHPKDTKRALFHYTKVSLFTLALIKQIFEKNRSPRAASGSWSQF